jgi:hypothetical protein
MITKAMIQVEIDRLDREKLDEAYRLIRGLTSDDRTRQGTLSRLKSVQIDGPEDFSANLDLYLNGEKNA